MKKEPKKTYYAHLFSFVVGKASIMLCHLCLLSAFSYAQQTTPWCGNDALMNRLRKQYPNFDAIIHERMTHASNGYNNGLNKVTLVVPVVVHIIHDNGLGNISDNQIQDALDILNEDYQRLNPDTSDTRNLPNAPFQSVAGAMDIEFKLAKLDPNGDCTNGIVRVNAPGLTHNANDDCKFSANGGSDQWPIDKYVNIWVVNSIDNGGGAGITLGYAYLPYWPGGNAHGILIRHDAFGTIETADNSDGRTLTHEMGHLLGLQHIFNEAGNGGTGCHTTNCNQTGDYCCDTPPQEAANWSCSFNWNSCNEVPTNDAFGFDAMDQIENYMSYNYCQNMFSMDQVNIMQQNFTDIDFMANWISANNAIATGVNEPETFCKADFEPSKTEVCSGDSIFITDRSFHNPTFWNWSITPGVENVDWTFSGGTTSISQHPYIQFFTSGLYNITLESGSASGGSDTETKTAVVKTMQTPHYLPYWEGFEYMTGLSNNPNWTVVNFESNNAFERVSGFGYNGNHCARLLNYGQVGANTDELISGPVDLSMIDTANNETVTLSFKYAYRKRYANNDEWLKVFVSKNCGDQWIQRKTLHGNSLSPLVANFSWTPASQSEWTTVHMTNITADMFVDVFRFKFEFEGNGGNNFFIDDINLYPGSPSNDVVVGISEENGLIGNLELYPNPADEAVQVSFSTTTSEYTHLQVIDMTGRVVANDRIHAQGGQNVVILDVSNLNPGVYTLALVQGGRHISRLFIKQ